MYSEFCRTRTESRFRVESRHYYYNTIRVSPHVQNYTLYLHIHVPLVHDTRSFVLYKAVSWPFKPNITTDLFSYYESEKEFIAVNPATKAHLLLTASDLRGCLADTELHICHPAVEAITDQKSCAYALLVSSVEDVQRQCTPMYTLHPRARYLSLRHGRDWVFSLPRPAKLTITGLTGTPYILPAAMSSLPRTGILRLPAGAAAAIDGALLVAGSNFASQALETDAVILPDVPALELHKNLLPIALSPEGQAVLQDALRDSNNSIELAGASLARVNQIAQQAETHMAVLTRAIKTPWGSTLHHRFHRHPRGLTNNATILCGGVEHTKLLHFTQFRHSELQTI